jgi:chemotaxis signal transduction protein
MPYTLYPKPSHPPDTCPPLAAGALSGHQAIASLRQSLLEREAPEGYYDQWLKMLHEGNRTRTGQMTPWIVFRLRQHWFGLPAVTIKQIMPAGPIHPVPGKTSSYLLGIVKAHGELPIAIDLEKLLFGDYSSRSLALSHDAQHTGHRHIWVEQGLESFIFPSAEVLELQYIPTGTVNDRLQKVHSDRPFSAWTSGQLDYDAKTLVLLDYTKVLHSLRNCLRWEEHG